jgi:hypothetical protein
MEGILAELERLRTEVEELRANRDHGMRLWQQVTTELLRRTPPSTIQLPGANAETITLLNVLGLGMEDVAAGRVESFEEVRKRITGAPESPDMDEIQAEVREVREVRRARGRVSGPVITPKIIADMLRAQADEIELRAGIISTNPFRKIPTAQAQAMSTTLCNLSSGGPLRWADAYDYLSRILIHNEQTIRFCYSEESFYE